jgi:hypothetical protein
MSLCAEAASSKGTGGDEGTAAVSRSFVLKSGNVGASRIVVGFVNLKQLLSRASNGLSERRAKAVVCWLTEFWYPGLTLGLRNTSVPQSKTSTRVF